jgi:hypothetical protein
LWVLCSQGNSLTFSFGSRNHFVTACRERYCSAFAETRTSACYKYLQHNKTSQKNLSDNLLKYLTEKRYNLYVHEN